MFSCDFSRTFAFSLPPWWLREGWLWTMLGGLLLMVVGVLLAFLLPQPAPARRGNRIVGENPSGKERIQAPALLDARMIESLKDERFVMHIASGSSIGATDVYLIVGVGYLCIWVMNFHLLFLNVFAICFYGYCWLVLVFFPMARGLVLKGRPALTLHYEGIYSPLLGDIPWRAIEKIGTFQSEDGRKGGIYFDAPYIEAYLEDMHPVERFIRRLSIAWSTLTFVLPLRKVSLKEVEMIAKNLWRQSMERPYYPVS